MMFTATLALLATLGQVQEAALAGERIGAALKITGRYKNVGEEAVKPEFKILVYDADHELLASGLTSLEPREIRAGGTATMTGLVLDLPATADYCEVVMVLDGDEVRPIDARRLPLSKHAREMARLAASVARIPEETQMMIFRDFFRRIVRATDGDEKLPKNRRRSFESRATRRVSGELSRIYKVTERDVATILEIGSDADWELPDEDGEDDEMIVHIPEITREKIIDEYLEMSADDSNEAAKLPESERDAYREKANKKLYGELARKYKVSMQEIKIILDKEMFK